MCGIAGFAYREPGRSDGVEPLRAMTQALRHRGPDAEGYHTGSGVGLGIRRLAIIDLETGDPPVYNEDRSIAVVCNGEIYNYIELQRDLRGAGHRMRTRSDAEVIAHLYEQRGIDCVDHLRGMFAFALWDARRRRLVLARDRFGIKPLYYIETPNGVLFGSEQKALLASGQVRREIDPAALWDLFSFGFVVGPKTCFRCIRQIPPGGRLVFEDGRSTIDRYWDLPSPLEPPDRRRTESEWSELLRAKLDEVVTIHMRSDVLVGAWLSGGLDSSAIVALMTRIGRERIPVASLSVPTSGLDEIHTQRTLLNLASGRLRPRIAVCQEEDLRRLPEAIWFAEDPSTSGLEILRLLLGEASTQDAKVVMTGEGADEVFGGYLMFRIEKLLRPFSFLPSSLRRMLAGVPLRRERYHRIRGLLQLPPEMTLERYRHLATPSADPATRTAITELLAPLGEPSDAAEDVPLPVGFSRWHPFSQLQYYEMKTRLPSFVVSTLDRGAMARSVEARVPFLDHELVELASQIPPTLKIRRLREKHILRRAMHGILPREIIDRPKRPLRAPVSAWFRRDLPEFAVDLLSESALRRTGYVRPDRAARMLAEHQSGIRDRGHLLMGLLTLQLWDQMFLRGHGPNL